ncbi:helix-turn-helix transcriptional regulator [Streptomyces sp. SCA2-2]|uniref:helix-turn-helix transcriptional regulator n=1 Tax=Streptomyces sp. SCA2-2 TaxID=1563677 RepID=UPI00101EC0D6|nr:LuxR family transcriptional regulator [Streptomyces sp. SCA2-2]RZE88474.1 LuxR family transcriptional regulator [Streptomyces sp. SCA2-2]
MPPIELPLLERDRELAALSAVIGELGSGRPAVVTVTGEPGLGQNDLLRWAAAYATDAGLRVLGAHATPAEHEVRYGVVAQLLAEENRALAPRLFLTDEQPGGLPGLNGLLNAVRDRPTLLVVRDTQWLDPASLRWLEALARRLPRAPVALLTSTTGTALTRPEWSVGTPLTGLATTIELALPPLTSSGTATAVLRAFGAPGDPAFTEALAEATRGIPAVVHDVLDRFARAGHSPRADRIDPLRALTAEVVGDHATRALSDLRDPAAVDALRALAVCGDLLDFPLVCTLAGPHSVSESRLRAALAASGLTTLRDGHPRVQDPVVRARVLEEMPAADRAELYARSAGLAQRVAADDQGIADLLLLARPVGDPWAVDTLRRGFTSALRGGRRDLAVAYLARALDEPLAAEDRARIEFQLASVEMVTAPAAAERRLGGLIRATRSGPGAGLRARATDLCLLGGDTRAARHALAGAIDSAPAAPEPRRGPTGAPAVPPEAEPPSTPRTHLVPHRPYAGTPPGATGPGGTRSAAPDLPGTARAHDASRSSGLEAVGRPDSAGPETDPAVAERHELTVLCRVASFLRHDDADLDVLPVPALPDAVHNPAVAGVWAWEHGVVGVHREEVRRLARSAFVPAATGRPLLVVPRLLGCRALLLTDDGDEAENHLGALLDESHRERAAISVAHILTVRAELHIRHGRPDAAARDLTAAQAELPLDRLHPLFLPYWLALSMITDLQNGHTERARETGARPLPPLAHESATTAQLLFARGVLARTDDEPHQAREHFRACGRWLLRHGCVNPAVQPWRSLAAEAAHTLGDTEEAGRLVHEEVRLARRWGAAAPLGRAQLSLAVVTEENRVENLRAAVATLGASPARTAYTRAVIALAAAEREENERRTAVALGPAATVLPPVAPPPGPHVPSAARPLGRPPGPRPAVLTGRRTAKAPGPDAAVWHGLTTVERETAALAAQGLGNREIATELAVTTRAVELRLSGVYRKLRIRGREELRALVQEAEGS